MNGKRLIETSFPEKEEFYSNLIMANIADADYMHAKSVCKDFEIKYLGKYYDFYLNGKTLRFADVFENFRKICCLIS